MAHTAKTKKILGLINGERTAPPAANPVIKPPDKDVVRPVFIKSESGTQIVNIAFLLVNEQVGVIMERFNCCTCEKCVAAVTSLAMKSLPQILVRVKRKSDEDAVNRAVSELRTNAVRIITKAVISVKSNPIH